MGEHPLCAKCCRAFDPPRATAKYCSRQCRIAAKSARRRQRAPGKKAAQDKRYALRYPDKLKAAQKRRAAEIRRLRAANEALTALLEEIGYARSYLATLGAPNA